MHIIFFLNRYSAVRVHIYETLILVYESLKICQTKNWNFPTTGLGITLLGILIIGCFFRWAYRRKHAPSGLRYQSKSAHTDVNDPYSNPEPESGWGYLGVPLFSYKELKEATNNFHHTTQLGNGGFGIVYYGKPFPHFDSVEAYIDLASIL